MTDPMPWWRRTEQVLGWSSFGFALAGMVAPGLTGRALGAPPGWSGVLATRDAALGVVLVRGAGPPGLALRALSDLGDAVLIRRRRPVVALLALVAAGLSAVAAASAAGDQGRCRHRS